MITRFRTIFAAALLAAATLSGAAGAQTAPVQSAALPPLGIALEGINYPYPVQYLDLTLEGQPVRMAYMDVPPAAAPNGKTIVLLHGKSFSGDYWSHTIATLTGRGYRVIALNYPHAPGAHWPARPWSRPRRCADRDCPCLKLFVLKILTSKLFDIKILQTLCAEPAPSKTFRGYGGGGVPQFQARTGAKCPTLGRSPKLYFS